MAKKRVGKKSAEKAEMAEKLLELEKELHAVLDVPELSHFPCSCGTLGVALCPRHSMTEKLREERRMTTNFSRETAIWNQTPFTLDDLRKAHIDMSKSFQTLGSFRGLRVVKVNDDLFAIDEQAMQDVFQPRYLLAEPPKLDWAFNPQIRINPGDADFVELNKRIKDQVWSAMTMNGQARYIPTDEDFLHLWRTGYVSNPWCSSEAWEPGTNPTGGRYKSSGDLCHAFHALQNLKSEISFGPHNGIMKLQYIWEYARGAQQIRIATMTCPQLGKDCHFEQAFRFQLKRECTFIELLSEVSEALNHALVLCPRMGLLRFVQREASVSNLHVQTDGSGNIHFWDPDVAKKKEGRFSTSPFDAPTGDQVYIYSSDLLLIQDWSAARVMARFWTRNFNYVGCDWSVADFSSRKRRLPDAEVDPGRLYWDEESEHLKVWNGSEWLIVNPSIETGTGISLESPRIELVVGASRGGVTSATASGPGGGGSGGGGVIVRAERKPDTRRGHAIPD